MILSTPLVSECQITDWQGGDGWSDWKFCLFSLNLLVTRPGSFYMTKNKNLYHQRNLRAKASKYLPVYTS